MSCSILLYEVLFDNGKNPCLEDCEDIEPVAAVDDVGGAGPFLKSVGGPATGYGWRVIVSRML